MKLNTLYGRGAITLSDDRREYRPVNGVLQVPDHLVNRAKAAGFTVHPLPEMAAEQEAAASAIADVIEPPTNDPPAIDASLSDEELLAQFEREATAAGYVDEAAAKIARERLAHLRAGGSGYDVLEPSAAVVTETVASVPSAPPMPSLDELEKLLGEDNAAPTL